MDIEYRWTGGSNEDFRCFYEKTEEYYCKRVEEKARRMGFKRAILQTRPIMLDAVGLYEKRGYIPMGLSH